MILPVIYAVVTWYFAMRWRRRWPAFLAVAASVLILIAGGELLTRWRDHLPKETRAGFVLLWPYTILVGAIGLYIAVLPRRIRDTQCRGCHYDLRGLRPVDLRCPECGELWRGRGSTHEERVELTPIPTGPAKRRIGI